MLINYYVNLFMAKDKLYVSMDDVSPTIYGEGILERLTKMHYIVPFIVYTPVIVFFVYRAVAIKQLPLWHFLWMFPLITIFWSWLEYVLHKNFLHRHEDGTPTLELANKIHEAHHEYPNDSYRLAVHLWASLPGAFVFYGISYLIFGNHLVDAAFASLVTYYLIYEFAHVSAHKINSKNPILMKIKKHHLKHHFQDDKRGYGFTSGIWDTIFKTDFLKSK